MKRVQLFQGSDAGFRGCDKVRGGCRWKIAGGVLALITLLGCAGMAHVDLPPKVVFPPKSSTPPQEPPQPDPTRPLTLPESRF